MSQDMWLWVGAAGAIALVYFIQGQTAAQATPLSVYPTLAAFSAAPASSAAPATVTIPAVTQWQSVQQAEQAAILAQCAGAGANVCSPLLGDQQLGL